MEKTFRSNCQRFGASGCIQPFPRRELRGSSASCGVVSSCAAGSGNCHRTVRRPWGTAAPDGGRRSAYDERDEGMVIGLLCRRGSIISVYRVVSDRLTVPWSWSHPVRRGPRSLDRPAGRTRPTRRRGNRSASPDELIINARDLHARGRRRRTHISQFAQRIHTVGKRLPRFVINFR